MMISDQVREDCASKHADFASNWPKAYPIEAYVNATYNCLLYELLEPTQVVTYTVASADVSGIYGHGATAEEAKENFRRAVETRIHDGLGGVYLGTSDDACQIATFRELEDDWTEDGATIMHRQHIKITVLT